MKRVIKRSEDIFGMATIGRHIQPNFTVAVNPDGNRVGNCYFKYYNRENYNIATHVTRLNLRKPNKIIHKNRDGKKEWQLNSIDKKAICQYLDQTSRYGVQFGATNWDYTLYSWNNELGLLEAEFPEEYSSPFEAFVNGFYDTEDNMNNPSYVPSTLKRPDYTQIR